MDVTDETFEKDVLEKSKTMPILVDFWASWCGPCMMLGPVLERVADDYSDEIELVKVNVEGNQKYAQSFGVQGIPAVKLFKNGKVVDEFVGAQPEGAIREFLDNNL